ncbi:putative GUP1 [Trypanosoma grayi]|uniref:putative GUP1 n=1 Tax=Trypanosoma grayi TaxID=71804 RepID=UPI0004F4B4AA|nr:putative GUP1 [Trypanosoma grayi]KEG09524.1 putative GUP1 [Trypanosoma grayi]
MQGLVQTTSNGPPSRQRGGSHDTVAPSYLSKSSFEYMFCAGTLILAAAYFGAYDIGKVSRENYNVLEHNLKPPWPPFCCLGSKGMDVTDRQWYSLTRALPVVLPLFGLFIYISRRLRLRLRQRENGSGVSSLYILHVVTGMLLGFGISGPRFAFAILLFLGNYYGIVKLHDKLPFKAYMTVMWVAHIAFLFINHYFDGYRFAWFGLRFLDSLWEPFMRWTVHYNMSVLRMIAFNTDMHEAIVSCAERREKALQKHDTSCIECAQMREAYARKDGGSVPFSLDAESLRCYKFRTEYPRSPHEYNILSYFGYLFYPPLYIAGPMSSFNAYVSHLHKPTRALDDVGLKRYIVRTVANFLLLIILAHYVYIIAILLGEPVFSSISFSRRAIVLYLTLGFLWLKFNCVWKLFRLLSLLDGIDVPEDMRRCFTNTVSIQGFWRDWHASFNLWIVRYMYIPMGGSRKKHFSIFPIFFFIAIWHDIEIHLLHWALGVCMCLLVELFLLRYVATHRCTTLIQNNSPLVYSMLRNAAGALSHLSLVVACMIGFNGELLYGYSDSHKPIVLLYILGNLNPLFLSLYFLFLCCCSHVGFAHRDDGEEQLRREQMRLGLCVKK